MHGILLNSVAHHGKSLLIPWQTVSSQQINSALQNIQYIVSANFHYYISGNWTISAEKPIFCISVHFCDKRTNSTTRLKILYALENCGL